MESPNQNLRARAKVFLLPKRQARRAYVRGLWRYRSPTRANAATRTGGVPSRLLLFSPPSSNCGRSNCNSRRRCMPPQVSCARGASKTRIESTSPNGCLRSGHHRGRALERRRVTTQARWCLHLIRRVSAIRGSLRPRVVGYFEIGLLKRMYDLSPLPQLVTASQPSAPSVFSIRIISGLGL